MASSSLLYNIGGALALIPGIFGVMIFADPRAALAQAEYKLPADEESRRLSDTLLRGHGIRNVVIAVVGALTWQKGDPVLLASNLLVVSSMPVVDGLLSLNLTGGGVWKHWPFCQCDVQEDFIVWHGERHWHASKAVLSELSSYFHRMTRLSPDGLDLTGMRAGAQEIKASDVDFVIRYLYGGPYESGCATCMLWSWQLGEFFEIPSLADETAQDFAREFATMLARKAPVDHVCTIVRMGLDNHLEGFKALVIQALMTPGYLAWLLAEGSPFRDLLRGDHAFARELRDYMRSHGLGHGVEFGGII